MTPIRKHRWGLWATLIAGVASFLSLGAARIDSAPTITSRLHDVRAQYRLNNQKAYDEIKHFDSAIQSEPNSKSSRNSVRITQNWANWDNAPKK